MTTFKTSKSVSETLTELRNLFRRYKLEEWEPIPDQHTNAYSVRWLQGGEWHTISSTMQVTKAQNLAQVRHIIQLMLLWGSRGVGGVSGASTFIHGGLATLAKRDTEDELTEAYATLGVDPDTSMEEVSSVYHAKIRYAHPDGVQDINEKRLREERTKRLNRAYEFIEKARKGK